MKKLLITFLFLSVSSAVASAVKDPLYDELEGIELVRALLRDGKLAPAHEALAGLGAKENGSAPARLVAGDLALAEGKLTEAERYFREALKAAGLTPPLREEADLGLARVYHRQRNSAECAAAAERAGETALRTEQDVLLRAACERGKGNAERAWMVLVQATARFSSFALFREQLKLLLVLGLREEASARTQSYVGAKASASEALACAEVLAEGGAKEEALLLLETARLRFPQEQDLLLAIGPLYFAKGLKRAAADAFALASVRDASYAEHAAELLRQLGARQRSRYLNVLIPGEKERGRQKLALAVEGNRWDLVASMDTSVRRSSLDEDDEVSYALAYSLARGGEVERPRDYLAKVRAPGMLSKVAALLKALEDCKSKGWRCL